MKRLLALFFALAMLTPVTCAAREFDTAGYQTADGAITTRRDGDFIDPYIAIKALLTAQQGGLEIAVPARAWIKWMLAHPGREGLLGHYCKRPDGHWQRCGRTDTDGAVLALWLQLLHSQAPAGGMPKPWSTSARTAGRSLARLRVPGSGVYRVSAQDPEALFADNVEIYSALVGISRTHNQSRQAVAFARQAEKLRKNIEQVFRPSSRGPFLVSAEEAAPKPRVYPDHVAQLYPLLHAMPAATFDQRAMYGEWISHYGRDWLRFETDSSPWGLIALAALSIGDTPTAHCWYVRAEPFRHTSRWNLLDDAAYQRIKHAEPFERPICERR